MMDDKTFQLLEKSYVDFSGRFNNLEKDLNEIKQDVKKNGNHIIRLEDEFHNKFGAISDDVSVVKDNVIDIKQRVESIEEKVDSHDIKIQVIEGGMKKKTI